MAARLNPRHQQMVRDKIQATQIVNRLEGHVLGDLELSPTQIQAARILLDKSVPNLQAIEHTGEVTVGVSERMRQILERAP